MSIDQEIEIITKERRTYMVVIGVIIDDQNRVLLTHRNQPDNVHTHEKWNLPGGGVDFGENPITSVHREIQEELGITVELLSEQPHLLTTFNHDTTDHFVLLIFAAKKIDGEIDTSKDIETSEAKWVDIDTIDYSQCLSQTKEAIDLVKELFKQ